MDKDGSSSAQDGRAVGIVLLAAGGSARMGRAKQLLPFCGTTLLRHAAKLALATNLSPVVVVLGAEAEACQGELAELPVIVAVNADWRTGMGSSIRVGMEALLADLPAADAILVMLHDQPLIAPAALVKLVELWRPPEQVIAAAFYGGTCGVPAVFDRELFGELRSLPDQEGAKRIILGNMARVARLEMPEAAGDIDRPEDYARLAG